MRNHVLFLKGSGALWVQNIIRITYFIANDFFL